MLNIKKGKVETPFKLVLYGLEGIGKTTLANMFPHALFLDLEQGSSYIDAQRIDSISTYPELTAALLEMQDRRQDYEEYKTIVLDTGDKVESMISTEVCHRNSKDNLVDIGYGNGFKSVREEWRNLLDKIDMFQRRTGKNMIIICHANLRKIEEPENSGAYDHWELRCTYGSDSLKAWADYLFFYKYESLLIEGDAKAGVKNKISGGRRVICTKHTVYYDAKSRGDLPPVIAVDKDSTRKMIDRIMSYTYKAGEDAHAALPAGGEERILSGIAEAAASPEPEAKPEAKPEAQSQVDQGTGETAARPEFEKLRNLMVINGVTDEQIVRLAAMKRIVPDDFQFRNFNESTCARFIRGWEVMHNAIKSLKAKGMM